MKFIFLLLIEILATPLALFMVVYDRAMGIADDIENMMEGDDDQHV